MGLQTILFVICLNLAPTTDNQEKVQKKELEARVKTITAEAQKLERAGQLAEARIRYAESQALIEVKEVTEALKRLDEEIHHRVKIALNDSRKLYDSQKYKEAAAALEAGMKLQAFQPVIASNLALCYFRLGDRSNGLEYLRKATVGTSDPKQKQKLLQLITFFTTGENALSMNDSDKVRIVRVNRLAESIGMEASLEDAQGGDESPSDEERAADQPIAQPTVVKTNTPASVHSKISTSRRSSLCDALGELKGTLAKSPAEIFNL